MTSSSSSSFSPPASAINNNSNNASHAMLPPSQNQISHNTALADKGKPHSSYQKQISTSTATTTTNHYQNLNSNRLHVAASRLNTPTNGAQERTHCSQQASNSCQNQNSTTIISPPQIQSPHFSTKKYHHKSFPYYILIALALVSLLIAISLLSIGCAFIFSHGSHRLLSNIRNSILGDFSQSVLGVGSFLGNQLPIVSPEKLPHFHDNKYQISQQQYHGKLRNLGLSEEFQDNLHNNKRQFFFYNAPFQQRLISYVNSTHFAVSLSSQSEYKLDSISLMKSSLQEGTEETIVFHQNFSKDADDVTLTDTASPETDRISLTVLDTSVEHFVCEKIHGDGYGAFIYQYLFKIDGLSLDQESDSKKWGHYTLKMLMTDTKKPSDSPETQELAFTLPTTFSSVPATNGETSSPTYTVLSFGDMNVNSASRSTMLNLLTQYKTDKGINRNLKMVIHQGDIPYAWDRQQQKWDRWADQVSPLSKHIFYQAGPGNHELSSYCGFESFQKRFTSWWGSSSHSKTNLWYSFDYLGIHWISLSSEHAYQKGSDQYNWLIKDLNSVNRKQTPFIVVYTHRPMYSSNDNHGSDTELRASIEPIFEQYAVDLAMFGHVHAYERARPTHNGTIHVQSGTAGYDLNPKWDHPEPKWSQYRETSHGFMRLLIQPYHSIRVEYLRNHFDAKQQAAPVVADSFIIERNTTDSDEKKKEETKPSEPADESKDTNDDATEQNDGEEHAADNSEDDPSKSTFSLINGLILFAVLSFLIITCLAIYLAVRIVRGRRSSRVARTYEMMQQEFDFSSGDDTSELTGFETDAADPKFALDDSDEDEMAANDVVL